MAQKQPAWRVVVKCNQTSRTWILSEDIHFVEERNETCYQDQGVIDAGFGWVGCRDGYEEFYDAFEGFIAYGMERRKNRHKLKYPLWLLPI